MIVDIRAVSWRLRYEWSEQKLLSPWQTVSRCSSRDQESTLAVIWLCALGAVQSRRTCWCYAPPPPYVTWYTTAGGPRPSRWYAFIMSLSGLQNIRLKKTKRVNLWSSLVRWYKLMESLNTFVSCENLTLSPTDFELQLTAHSGERLDLESKMTKNSSHDLITIILHLIFAFKVTPRWILKWVRNKE